MPKSLALRSREAGKARGETGDAEVEDLAIQDWSSQEKRRVAMRAKERHSDPGGAVPSKMLSVSVLPSTAHHITCHSPAESVIRR